MGDLNGAAKEKGSKSNRQSLEESLVASTMVVNPTPIHLMMMEQETAHDSLARFQIPLNYYFDNDQSSKTMEPKGESSKARQTAHDCSVEEQLQYCSNTNE